MVEKQKCHNDRTLSLSSCLPALTVIWQTGREVFDCLNFLGFGHKRKLMS